MPYYTSRTIPDFVTWKDDEGGWHWGPARMTPRLLAKLEGQQCGPHDTESQAEEAARKALGGGQ